MDETFGKGRDGISGLLSGHGDCGEGMLLAEHI